jgi:uncharacterized membrane protein YoaK (UPF0700 family)
MPDAEASPSQALSPERRAVNSLSSAVLLAFTGGSLDAFLYLNHGKVFAGAMTGNSVLAGIALLSHDHQEAVHHLLPIAAFIVGVWCEQLLERHVPHAVIFGLSAEIVVLFAASWLPSNFPDNVFIVCVTLVAAYQIASFRQVDEFTYNSTFITGNLRAAIEALHGTVQPEKRRESLCKFRDLGLVVVVFICGAMCGALLAPRALNRTLWLPVAALTVVLTMVVGRELRAAAETKRASSV